MEKRALLLRHVLEFRAHQGYLQYVQGSLIRLTDARYIISHVLRTKRSRRMKDRHESRVWRSMKNQGATQNILTIVSIST